MHTLWFNLYEYSNEMFLRSNLIFVTIFINKLDLIIESNQNYLR